MHKWDEIESLQNEIEKAQPLVGHIMHIHTTHRSWISLHTTHRMSKELHYINFWKLSEFSMSVRASCAHK